MFAIYLIGLAILAILSGAFSYMLILLEIALIAVLSFLVYYFVIKRPRVLLWIIGISLLGIIGSGIYLHRQEMLIPTVDVVVEFLRPYYYSVSIEQFYIGRLHQQLMIFVIGIFLYPVIVWFYHSERFKFVPPLIGIVIVIPAFIGEVFSSSGDFYAFYTLIVASFIYYFEVYYLRLENSEGNRKRSSFYLVGFLMVATVLGLSIFINNMFYNPFMEKKSGSQGTGNALLESNIDLESDYQELIYTISDEYAISDSFEHQGIALFKVKSDMLKYFQAQSYNEYVDGIWVNNIADLSAISSYKREYPIIESLQGELDREIFHTEQVEVEYRSVLTDSVITAPYMIGVTFEDAFVDADINSDGMMVTDELVGKDFAYTMEVAVPKYRTTYMSDHIKELEKNYGHVINGDDPYLLMPNGYRELEELAKEITKGYSTNFEKAQAIEHYFKTEFTYNEEPVFESNDMINEFIFNTKEGFCQQFATAMVLMLRSQNIPSRFVSGFVIGVDQMEAGDLDMGSRYMPEDYDPFKYIYDSNAHTWVEVYIDGFGWIQYEPTPGQDVTQFYDPIEAGDIETLQTDERDRAVAISRETITISSGVIVVFVLLFMVVLFMIRGRRLKANIWRRFLVNYKLLLMYLNAGFEEKKKYETFRQYSDKMERRFVDYEYNITDFTLMVEEAFYNDVVPTIDQVEAFESFMEAVKHNTKKEVIPLAYRRLRFHEIITKHRKFV